MTTPTVRPEWSIARADGRWFALDDRCRVRWSPARWDGVRMTHACAVVILSTYAPSTRRRLRIVRLDGEV